MRHLPSRYTTFVILTALLFSHVSSAGTFRVMLHTGSFPPYFFEENDLRTGTIKDVFSAIALETGDSFEYIRVPFKRALHQFEIGEIDIEPMTNPVYRGESSVLGVYSIPYTGAEEIILFNKNHHVQVSSPEDLLGKTIGVVNGYYYPKYDAYFKDGRIKPSPVKNENLLIKLLLANRYSQVLINKDFAQYKMKEQDLKEQLTVGQTYHALDMMIRFHPSKQDELPRFNKAIQKLKTEGVIENIYNNYR